MKKNAQLRQPTQAEIQPVLNALNAGQLPVAESAAKKMLKQFPNAFVVHNLYGNALAGQNKFKDAVDAFRKALKIDPNIAEFSNYTVVAKSKGKTKKPSKSVPKSLNNTKNDTNSTNTPPQKTKGVHKKNRERVRKFVSEYKEQYGKYPTREEVRLACSVGPAVAGEILKEVKAA